MILYHGFASILVAEASTAASYMPVSKYTAFSVAEPVKVEDIYTDYLLC